MSDPKGFLVVPVGFRSDGSIHALELDASDRLKVLIDAITNDVSIVQTDPTNLQVGNNGWYNSAWQKNPIPFGASERIAGQYANSSLPAGTTTATMATVPGGEYWVITAVNIQATTTTATILRVAGLINTQQVYLVEQRGVTSNSVYINNCNLVLFPTDTLQVNIVGATAGDILLGRYAGYRVDIDQ